MSQNHLICVRQQNGTVLTNRHRSPCAFFRENVARNAWVFTKVESGLASAVYVTLVRLSVGNRGRTWAVEFQKHHSRYIVVDRHNANVFLLSVRSHVCIA